MDEFENAFHSQFTRMNAIGNSDTAISVTCQHKAWIVFQSGINAVENFGMTKIVLRHGFSPHEDARDEWFSSDTECQVQFFLCQFQQFIFIPGDILLCATNEDANKCIAFRRAVREFGSCPCTCESFASFTTRDNVAITIQLVGYFAQRVPKRDGGG